jgi:hypothetical protein
MMSETITQRLGITTPVSNQTINSGGTATVTTGSVDMQKFHRAFFLVEIGTVVSGGTVTLQLIESASANLSSAQAPQTVSNISLTGLNTSNKQYSFEIRADQLDAGYRYVGLQATETSGSGGHNVAITIVGFGDEANHKPGNANNDSTTVAAQSVAA